MLPAPMQTARRVMVAPMAGGPSTPELVAAASAHGAFAQLAAGYLSAEALRERIRATRALGATAFGVNLFVPNPHPVAPDRYSAFALAIADDAAAVGAEATSPIVEDDDAWDAKLAVIVEEGVPVVSCTFGLPDAAALRTLRDAGVTIVQTVTSVDEARAAAAAGVDALVVQGFGAGGHSGVWAQGADPVELPLVDLVRSVVAATGMPVVAAGGVADRDDVRLLLESGADGVAIGTAALAATEAGTSATHRAALADAAFDRTTLTRAFTGRPARALANAFTRQHADAPSGYPALHHLTRPMRTAAAAAGDAQRLHLWAGVGWRTARSAPIADILDDLEP